MSFLSRPTSLFSRSFVAPNVLQFARLKSTTTKSILFSPSPRKLEVAVTPKRVTLKFAEDFGSPVVPKAPKTKGLMATIEEKIGKGLDALETKVVKTKSAKATAPVKQAKAAKVATGPKASQSYKKASPSRVESTEPVPCWVDASPTHIAIIIGDQYKVFSLNDGWMTKARDVNWAETAAFELLAQILAQQRRTGIIQVNSDSFTALRALSGERIKVPEIMESARRTGDILKTSMFTIKGVKVSRTTNLADGFTRGKTVNGYEEIKDDIAVPEALVPFVTAV